MPFPLLPSTPSTASQINRLEATLQIVTQESAAKSSDISEQQLELTAALSAREQVEAQAASLTARVAELETAAACTESALSEQSQATEEVAQAFRLGEGQGRAACSVEQDHGFHGDAAEQHARRYGREDALVRARADQR